MAKRNIDEKFLSTFTDLMINKIKSITDNWEKPWVNAEGRQGLPQNLEGRDYKGINSLLLYFVAEKENYELPVYLTFKQAINNNLQIEKGSKSVPIIYWNFSIKDKNTGTKITIDDYNNLSKNEREKYTVLPFMKHYNVFNVDQTNIKKVLPEVWAELEEKFKVKQILDDKGMMASKPIDQMLADKSWVVPINIKKSDRAFYSLNSDSITMPLKAQFKNGESFYSTLLHEMAHSTGYKDRLNRLQIGVMGDKNYGREELVAELTAAISGQAIGISKTIRKENAQYLKSWLGTIKEKPEFLIDIISDVNKASNMILDVVEKEQLKIYENMNMKETPIEIKEQEKNIPDADITTEARAYIKRGLGYDYVHFNSELNIPVYYYLLKNGYDSVIDVGNNGKSRVEVPNWLSDQLADTINNNQLTKDPEKKRADNTINDKENNNAGRITDVRIFKHYTGQYAIQCLINGKEQKPEILSYNEEKAFFKEKSISAIDLAYSKYHQFFTNENSQSFGMKK